MLVISTRVRFEITSMISDQNCTPLNSATTLLQPFCYREISDFCLKQSQGMRGRAAPPHPRIYRVPPAPGIHTKNGAILKHE